MCGIVGYVGDRKCAPILLNGLKNLEYRGYDSAGIAVIEKDSLQVIKEKGRVKNLEDVVDSYSFGSKIGIAHTRWATHGIPSKQNAHPHLNNTNTFAVVHNGIIENHVQIRNFLKECDYNFYSQTDTEVIPNLIHYYYIKQEKTENGFLNAVSLACKDLKGSFAILVLCKDFPNIQIVAKKDSPLVIGKGENEFYIASDMPAILEYTKDFFFLDDNEIALITKNTVNFFDINLVPQTKDFKHINLDSSASSKNGYEDFMLKEIHEQPQAIYKTLKDRVKLGEVCNFSDISLPKKDLLSINQIYIVACGTAMNAGLVGKNIIEKLCNIPVNVEIASEFRYRNPLIDKHTLCIFISQSGETADTIAALKLAKSQGAKTLAVSNVIGSSITREADYTIYTHAGPEIAVASTKAYTSQVVLIALLAIYFAEILGRCDKAVFNELKSSIVDLPAKIETILDNMAGIENFAKTVYEQRDMFFLGRGIDYCTALEGSLKLKEISYIHSEAYASGELKHGPIALIENDVTVIGILTDPSLVEKSVSNLQEVITRGASTLIITNQTLPNINFENVVNIPDTHPLLSPVLAIIPLQLLSYYISKNKGLDVDKPRNLAKSVTVE